MAEQAANIPLDIPPRPELIVRAHGHPAKQGSKDFKGMRRGKPVLVEADEKLPEWRETLISAAKNAKLACGWLMLNDAVEITAVVYLPRPKTVTRKYPTGRQDGVYYDDSLVIDGHIHKRYADGRPPGATIRITAVSEQGALL
jgi:hypothetical protein